MPKVHVKLHDWSNEENVAGLRDGRLNLALVVRPPKAASLKGIRFQELVRERIRLAVPPHHAFATRRSGIPIGANLKIDISEELDHPKIDNATKVFFHDFIVRFAVRFGRVVSRSLPLVSTVTLTALPAMSLTPVAPFGPDVIEDECGD